VRSSEDTGAAFNHGIYIRFLAVDRQVQKELDIGKLLKEMFTMKMSRCKKSKKFLIIKKGLANSVKMYYT